MSSSRFLRQEEREGGKEKGTEREEGEKEAGRNKRREGDGGGEQINSKN